ncbi:hypothetical protein PTE_04274 [Photorhabdus khanii NC19]|uniref:Uncharacterized protein n=1 Tax=Photorhabdus khanii NC19 TaxID=1004151 RepID=W3V3Y7_9GAMM|nr:hypothetical protein PTE_04274 [Photorhabdus khanii NC19]
MTTKIDTEIRRATPAGHNIFFELGFTEQEARANASKLII